MYPSLITSFPGDLFAGFDAVHRQLQRLFGLADEPSSIRAARRGAFPALNVGTTEEAVEIYAFAPGLDPAGLELSIEGGVLTLSGERKADSARDGSQSAYYANERFAGAFRRAIALPEDVDASRIEATYRNGVLRIAVPKLEVRSPRRIEVKELEYKQ